MTIMHTTDGPEVTRVSVDRDYLEHYLHTQRAILGLGTSPWFSPETMRWFKTRIMGDAFTAAPRAAVRDRRAALVFVTSEPYAWNGPRVYTVRLLARGEVGTIGELGQYPTRSQALTAARRLARDVPGWIEGEGADQ